MMVRTPTIVASAMLLLLGGATARATTPDTSVPHGTFQAVGNTTTPRLNPTATLLSDGTVLVVGGLKASGADYSGSDLLPQAAAEVFDPQTNSFHAVGPMAYPRYDHAAVRLQD